MASNELDSRPLPSGRHNLPREFVIRSQRDRLLQAMADCCDEKPYPQITVAGIVERAGVSRRTFYDFFADKEECFLAAYDAVSSRFLAEVIAACQIEGLTWTDQIRIGLEAILAFLAREPANAKMCMVEIWSAGPQALERYFSVIRVLAGFIDAGRGESAAAAKVPTSVSAAVFAGSAIVINRELVDGRARFLPELLPELLYSVLVPYLGTENALEERRKTRAVLAGSSAEAGGSADADEGGARTRPGSTGLRGDLPVPPSGSAA